MNHCKDCFYFDAYFSGCDKIDGLEKRELIAQDGFGLYVDVSDDTGLIVDFRVGPLFGCVQWKLKDED